MIYIMDTYAWIEYFIGSEKGLIVKNIIDDKKNKIITMECCLAELNGFSLKNDMDFEKIYNVVKTNSLILPVLKEHWLNAATIRHELRHKISNFGLIDSILVSKQLELKCKIVSGDTHFKTVKNVIYIG